MEILCSFRLVTEGKTGKEIPESSRLEFLEKLIANSFVLSDAEDNTSSLLNTIRNSSKVLRPKFLGSDSRNFPQRLLACLNFTLDLQDLFCWNKQKK